MTDEEILRRILHEEALAVNPEGSFDDVERRIGRSPRWLAPVAAAAALAVVVGAVALVAAQDGDTDVTTGPAGPTPTEAPAPTVQEPAPVEVGQGVWPFHTGDDADKWAVTNPGGPFFDPEETARRFLAEYVGMTEIDVDSFAQGDSRSGEVVARTRDGGPTTAVLLRLLGESDVWTVTGAFTDTIRLDQPDVLAEVSSPVHVRGESCCAFEGNVIVQVKEDGQIGSEEFLGQEPLIGGSMAEYAPLEGEVTLDAPPTRAGGAVVAFTTSAQDGSVERASVVRVSFASEPGDGDGELPAGPALDDDQMVAVTGGPGAEIPVFTVAVMDATDGSVIRELARAESAEGGILDVALTPDRRTVLYTLSTSACGSELHAVSTDGALDRVIAQGQLPTPRQIAVHPRDGRIAVSTDDDCDGQSELVVTGFHAPRGTDLVGWPDAARDETGADALPANVRSIAWVDDDTLALGMQYEDGTTTRLHDLTNPHLPVGSGPDVIPDEGDGRSYDTPTTTGAEGTFAVVERCCGLDPSSSVPFQVTRDGSRLDDRGIELDGSVVEARWAAAVPFWVTGDFVLQRWVEGGPADVAEQVVDFAL